MQIMINIPEEDYILATKEDFSSIYNGNHIAKAIKNGTPIPDNATNADAIRTLFPYGIPKDIAWILQVNKSEDWWNAPYQKGGKE